MRIVNDGEERRDESAEAKVVPLGEPGNLSVEQQPLQRVRPWGYTWRSSNWYITTVVAIGIGSDAVTYSIIIPVLPFELEKRGYSNLSSRMGWLLFALSFGLLAATPPVAYFFHRHKWRRGPLVVAVIVMEASILLFMFATNYRSMIVARVMQGACSCVIWTVGFALITENISDKSLGAHIGFAMTGVTVGATIGPVAGGAMYKQLGWYAPYIFCLAINGIDLVARLLVLEKRRYGDDPDDVQTTALPETELSLWGVLKAMMSITRGITALSIAFFIGLIFGSIEATLALHVYQVWNKRSDIVGYIFLAAAIPEAVVSPLTGLSGDKFGAEWVVLVAFVFYLPWSPLLTLRGPLAAFFVFFSLANVGVAIMNTALSLEVALVSKLKPGINQFAALNVVFSLSLSLGSVIGGQVYDHVRFGWNLLCWLDFGGAILLIIPAVLFVGERPLFLRWRKREEQHVALEEHQVETLEASANSSQ